MIVKIQECEALLAAATDKGEQIAAAGSAADRNMITQQLQSLKQQLTALRRAVERQRQQHEAAAAEHIKLAAELDVVLGWLHAHEAEVRSRPVLSVDVASVLQEQEKHKVTINFIYIIFEISVRVKYLKKLKSMHFFR